MNPSNVHLQAAGVQLVTRGEQSMGALAAMSLAGVPLINSLDGPKAPGWALVLWRAAADLPMLHTYGWRRTGAHPLAAWVLTEAQRDPEKRAAMLTVVELAADPFLALAEMQRGAGWAKLDKHQRARTSGWVV